MFELFFEYLGITLSIGLAAIGAGLAISSVGSSLSGAITEKPETFAKLLIPVVLGEAIAIYGMLVSFIILSSGGNPDWSFAFKALCAGAITGLTCLGAGIGIASTGSAMAGAVAEEPMTFSKSMITVVLAEALAIYGLLIAFMLLIQ